MTTLEYDRFEKIEDIKYTAFAPRGSGAQMAQMQDVIEVTLESGEHIRVKNTGFTLQNWGLCFLSYVGARPSNLDAAIGTQIPLNELEGGSVFPPDWVFKKGKQQLEESTWGPEA